MAAEKAAEVEETDKEEAGADADLEVSAALARPHGAASSQPGGGGEAEQPGPCAEACTAGLGRRQTSTPRHGPGSERAHAVLKGILIL